jgi:hypothetical protein
LYERQLGYGADGITGNPHAVLVLLCLAFLIEAVPVHPVVIS